jgi:aminobenzoyl-glutamate utilization protein B
VFGSRSCSGPNEQQKNQKYVPMISAEDKPQVQINADIMAQHRPEMKKCYYNPSTYLTYLKQLGIRFPVLEKPKN